MGTPVAGAAVVCLDGERVLLARRGREPNKGRWSFPGGKIEPGETARAAAAREALEETGVEVRVLDVVDVYDALFPPYHFVVADYLAEPVGEQQPRGQSDATDARWVPFADLHAYDLTEAMERVLVRARWLRSVRRGAPPCLGFEPEPVPPAGLAVQASDPTDPTDQTDQTDPTGVPTPNAQPPTPNPLRGLYVITDDTISGGRSHVELARAALAGGARVVQLRDKRRDAGELLPIAIEIRELCRRAGALFIVNDRVDLAGACDADGVHLGVTDLPVGAARTLLGPGKWIGYSPETAEQLLAAETAGADYYGVGAIYGTVSKSDAGPPVGLDHLRRLRALTSRPVVAIGGITIERLAELRAAGADGAAVIGAVAAAPDPAVAARRLVEAWDGPPPG
jgi:thiamine-phosphate pyrophosphorylase